MRHVPVVVVGGGPVGMVSGDVPRGLRRPHHAGQYRTELALVSKGSTHNARTMEHYRRLGLSRGHPQARPPDRPSDRCRFLHGAERMGGWDGYRCRRSGRRRRRSPTLPRPTRSPSRCFRCNQMYVEARAAEAPCKRSTGWNRGFGWRCSKSPRNRNGSKSSSRAPRLASARTISCDYLAGCDGPQSTVRRHLGISYRGDRPEEQSYGSGATVATHLRAPGLYQILKHKRCWQYRTVNPNVRSNLVTLDGEGEFTINTKLRNPDEKPGSGAGRRPDPPERRREHRYRDHRAPAVDRRPCARRRPLRFRPDLAGRRCGAYLHADRRVWHEYRRR